jgi:hypothetical protein
MQRDILDSYSQAFATGVGAGFLLATVLALVAMVIVFIGMGRRKPV